MCAAPEIGSSGEANVDSMRTTQEGGAAGREVGGETAIVGSPNGGKGGEESGSGRVEETADNKDAVQRRSIISSIR